MTGEARSLVAGVPSAFDFDSQAGILFVLKAIRVAVVEPSVKNELKDLVFIYNTGAKDEAVRKKLETQLATHGITPQSVSLEVVERAVVNVAGTILPVITTSGFPTGRLTPEFTIQSPVALATPIPLPTYNKVLSVSTAVEKGTPVEPAPGARQSAVVSSVRPIVVQVQPVVKISVPNVPVPASAVANNIEISKPVSEATAQVIPETISAPNVSTEPTEAVAAARMERIRVIKSDVNARVGNPVNLVEVDNTLGREYMSALLEAMKLLSSVSVQESESAMKRLEVVYRQVLALLELRTSEPSQVPPEITMSAPKDASPPRNIPVPAPLQSSVPLQSSNFAVRSKVSAKTEESSRVSGWEATAVPTDSAHIDIVPSVAEAVAIPDVVTVARLSTPPAVPLRPVVEHVAPSYYPETAQSVSNITPLRAITELPTADEVSDNEAMSNNPLYTKDVDAGLDQLLGEWSLFKKSGLFGTGAKGREHPLYLKISLLQVPLILSGRFEGSNQEIKQSITDYMNGWRYEQGIIYEANETFDLYLRRVIRHIIDLQKTKRRS